MLTLIMTCIKASEVKTKSTGVFVGYLTLILSGIITTLLVFATIFLVVISSSCSGNDYRPPPPNWRDLIATPSPNFDAQIMGRSSSSSSMCPQSELLAVIVLLILIVIYAVYAYFGWLCVQGVNTVSDKRALLPLII